MCPFLANADSMGYETDFRRRDSIIAKNNTNDLYTIKEDAEIPSATALAAPPNPIKRSFKG